LFTPSSLNQFDPGPGLCYFSFMGNKHFLKSLGDGGNKRLRFNLETRKGRVVNFLVQLEFRLKNKWLPVVRYDFSHGFPHRDVLSQRGAEDKSPLKLETLEQCVQYAEQDLSDRYEWYLDRFLKN
jgi:hypothetical protein